MSSKPAALSPTAASDAGTGRDAGLARGIGASGLAMAVFNTVVGAGIFVLPAALARDIGSAAPLAYLGCGIGMAGVVLCFAAAASRVPTSGGPYGYAEAAFGPYVGFLIGVLVWLGAVLAAAGISAAIADAAGRFIPLFTHPPERNMLIVALLGAIGAINILGVAPGARLVGLLTVVKLVPLAVLLGVGALHVHVSNLALSVPAPSAFGRAMLLAAFSFQGMEGALAVSGEVRRPARNIPLGLLSAMSCVALLYVAIQVVTEGVLGPALGRSAAPLADALAGVSPALVALLLVGATVSMMGYLAGDMLSAPRILFAFGRDRFLPRWVAVLHSRTRAPYVAILLHVGVGALLAVSGSFAELAVLSALATVGVYIVSCVAAVVLQRRHVARSGPPLKLPMLPAAAAVGVVSMIWIGAHATWREALGFVATLVVSTIWYVAALKLNRSTGRTPPA
ncbi:APC family permease [Caulobacter sp. S45]|uniref:APC family permease n=1 Tax=Caulobacter sp. S45 TaxID=1641861 RepID=UPI0015766D14|nr:APC family permease [Caulobacter sp. S45]